MARESGWPAAMGRNNEMELARLNEHFKEAWPCAKVEIVEMTGQLEEGKSNAVKAIGLIDDLADFSPPSAANSSHVRNG